MTLTPTRKPLPRWIGFITLVGVLTDVLSRPSIVDPLTTIGGSWALKVRAAVLVAGPLILAISKAIHEQDTTQ